MKRAAGSRIPHWARKVRPWQAAVVLLVSVVILSLAGPKEATLGSGVRLVYLHGAWVWTALLCLAASAVSGLVGLHPERATWSRWSVGMGRAGIAFWVTYLPISLVAMNVNWNGLYLSEPRWILGVNTAVTGLLLQLAILLIDNPRLAGLTNAFFFAMLVFLLASTDQVLHPPSPIFSSHSGSIRLFFFVLLILCGATGFLLGTALRPQTARGA